MKVKKCYLGVWVYKEDDQWYMYGRSTPFKSYKKIKTHIRETMKTLSKI